jgi:hypothetical protein
MHAGRDRDGNFRKLHEELSSTKEEAVRTVCEEAPLAEYLAEGLVLAQKRFVDLDGGWQIATPRTRTRAGNVSSRAGWG